MGLVNWRRLWEARRLNLVIRADLIINDAENFEFISNIFNKIGRSGISDRHLIIDRWQLRRDSAASARAKQPVKGTASPDQALWVVLNQASKIKHQSAGSSSRKKLDFFFTTIGRWMARIWTN
jgi:hypothetical protein